MTLLIVESQARMRRELLQSAHPDSELPEAGNAGEALALGHLPLPEWRLPPARFSRPDQ